MILNLTGESHPAPGGQRVSIESSWDMQDDPSLFTLVTAYGDLLANASSYGRTTPIPSPLLFLLISGLCPQLMIRL